MVLMLVTLIVTVSACLLLAKGVSWMFSAV